MNCFARSSDANAGKVAHHRVVDFLAALPAARTSSARTVGIETSSCAQWRERNAFDEGVEDCDLLRTFEVILCLFAGVNSDFK